MKFEVYGPIEMPKKVMRANTLRKAIDEKLADNPETLEAWKIACGCYVFAIAKKGGVAKPWYVGKTTKNFRYQCLSSDKPSMYLSLLRKQSHGTPLLYLVAQVKPTHRGFAKPNDRAIDYLESMLIGMGLQRNKKLENISKTQMLRKLKVVGFMNTKRLARGGPTKNLRDIFDIKST